MRVYGNGKPAKLDHYLKWSAAPLESGELVFVSGNPGRTQRIFTVAALKYLRETRIPYLLDFLRRKEILMQQFSLKGKEASRRARDELWVTELPEGLHWDAGRSAEPGHFAEQTGTRSRFAGRVGQGFRSQRSGERMDGDRSDSARESTNAWKVGQFPSSSSVCVATGPVGSGRPKAERAEAAWLH